MHPILIYEGTDVRPNLEVTLGRLTKQFSDLDGSKIDLNGKSLTIKQFGVFDLCALNAILGKQNHSSTYFDLWTNVTLEHIRKHKNKPHTPRHCPNIEFLNLGHYTKNLANHVVNTGGKSSTGKHYGSVVGNNLIPLKNIFRYISPLMHTTMGLGNDTFRELKRCVIELDIKHMGTLSKGQEDIKNKY